MTEIERRALALVNEVRAEYPLVSSEVASNLALCRAIEQHEAFKQEVSDAVEATLVHMLHIHGATTDRLLRKCLGHFILSKPDPLVEALAEAYNNDSDELDAANVRAAIEKRGGKIVWGEG